jgi:hypothetical protein
MDKAEHTELSTGHSKLFIGMESWKKLGYPLGYTDSYSDIPTHTVMYNVYTSISWYIAVTMQYME